MPSQNVCVLASRLPTGLEIFRSMLSFSSVHSVFLAVYCHWSGYQLPCPGPRCRRCIPPTSNSQSDTDRKHEWKPRSHWQKRWILRRPEIFANIEDPQDRTLGKHSRVWTVIHKWYFWWTNSCISWVWMKTLSSTEYFPYQLVFCRMNGPSTEPLCGALLSPFRRVGISRAIEQPCTALPRKAAKNQFISPSSCRIKRFEETCWWGILCWFRFKMFPHVWKSHLNSNVDLSTSSEPSKNSDLEKDHLHQRVARSKNRPAGNQHNQVRLNFESLRCSSDKL